MSFKIPRTKPKPDTRDIVDWLRQLVNQRIAAFGEKGMEGCRYGEAADDIERLRAEVQRLKGVVAADMLETGSCGSGADQQTEASPPNPPIGRGK